jgi:predicted transcriptional regulator
MANTGTKHRSPAQKAGKLETGLAADAKLERMVRKQILLTPEQSRRMKALAAATGRTEADLFREAVDAKLASAPEADWKTELMAAVAEWPEDTGIGDRIAENRARWGKRHDRLWGSKAK